MAAFTELMITDGTDYIDLLRHFNEAGFRPGTLTYKDGGVFQSGLGDGRRLVQRFYDNITDEISLVVKTGCQASAISDLRRLRQMLEAAADYWTSNWSNVPVWLEARAPGDSARRYATIIAGMAPGDPDPFAHPFAGPLNSLAVVQLSIEHLPWSDKAPGDSDLLPISVVQVGPTSAPYGSSFGNIDANNDREEVTDGTAFVTYSDPNHTWGNKNDQILNQITYVYDYKTGTNFYPIAAVNFPLELTGNYTGGPFVNTGIYFGSAGAPFSSLVFDISRANVNLTFGAWQYWDGAAWSNLLDVNDSTNLFANTGINTVTWRLPTDWAKSTEFTVNTYWVRVTITNSGGPASAGPKQDNRQIYTVSSPYVEIQADNIGGDVPALVTIQANSNYKASAVLNNAVMIAARSTSRGEEFSPYIGLTDEGATPVPFSQAYTLTSDGGADILFQDAPESPYGRCLEFSPAATDAETLTFSFSTVLSSWQGLFRAFVRCYQPSGTYDDFRIAIQLAQSGVIVWTGDFQSVTPAARWLLLDLGMVELRGEYDYDLQMVFWKTTTDSVQLLVYDLILMPVDEWTGEISYPPRISSKSLGTFTSDKMASFLVDPLTYPSQSTWAVVGSTNNQPNPIEPIPGRLSAPGPSTIQVATKQRLWFLGYYTNSTGVTVSFPYDTLGIIVKKADRYQHLKGSKK